MVRVFQSDSQLISKRNSSIVSVALRSIASSIIITMENRKGSGGGEDGINGNGQQTVSGAVSVSSYRSTQTVESGLNKVGKSVADVDSQSLQAFRTLRHFDVSVPIPRLEETLTKKFKDQFMETKANNHQGTNNGKKVIPRRTMHTSTHKLDSLTKSCFTEFDEVKSFKRMLIEERTKQRKQEMATTLKLIGSSSSSSPPRIDRSEGEHTSPLTVNYLASAKEKLGIYSQSFEPKLPDNQIWISGFHGARLTQEEFKRQIRRCLGLKLLNSKEIDALFATLELDVLDTVDGVHFTRLFFALGHQHRHAVQTTSLHNLLQQEKQMKQKQDDVDEKMRQWETLNVCSDSYTAADEEIAFGLLREVAMRKESKTATEAFESFLTPAQFKMQLFKSFGIELTKEQVRR